jgi:hypothetical protein
LGGHFGVGHMGKLTALALTRPMKAGLHSDGDGLYLQAGRTGSKSWIYRFARHGKQHYLGLGSAKAISLKEARELAAQARNLCAKGIDPLAHRREQRATSQLAAMRGMTFKQCADRLIDAHEGTWRNPKHRQQWRNTLLAYAYPIVGDLPVADIDTGLVVKVLQPIWTAKPPTAGRLRGRIGKRARLGDRRRLSAGRQSGQVARSPSPSAGEPRQGAQGSASPCPALSRASGLRARAARSARH